MIETFPIGVNELILLPKQSAWTAKGMTCDAHLSTLSKLFDPEFLIAEDLVTNTASGRGLVYFFKAFNEKCVLRHYYRGGLVAKISTDKFLYYGLEGSRPYQELNLLATLYTAGLNVPKPLAAKLTRKGLTYTSDIITGAIDNAQELHEHILQHPLEQSVWAKVGTTLRQMHDLQACHYDINVKNILLQRPSSSRGGSTENIDMEIYLLDFDGCKIRQGDAWKNANLDRFKRSLEKQQAKFSPYYYDEQCWLSLETAYRSSGTQTNQP
jgi:3-deoxy-D-manno-octulosonic acid kinase